MRGRWTRCVVGFSLERDSKIDFIRKSFNKQLIDGLLHCKARVPLAD
jgi:hypothetical protein